MPSCSSLLNCHTCAYAATAYNIKGFRAYHWHRPELPASSFQQAFSFSVRCSAYSHIIRARPGILEKFGFEPKSCSPCFMVRTAALPVELLSHNRHPTVSNNIYRGLRSTIRFLLLRLPNRQVHGVQITPQI